MRRMGWVLLGGAVALALCGAAGAASEQAIRLRSQNGLSGFSPPQAFLDGNFLADEDDPAYIFGRVRDFAATHSCPATWLIEESERRRLETRVQTSAPLEYSIYLETDCPGAATYYVFVDRSLNPAQWLEWRRQFHKNKAEPHYRVVKAGLEQAARDGVTVAAELRFVVRNGELLLKRPEDILAGELKFPPVYDLKKDPPAAK